MLTRVIFQHQGILEYAEQFKLEQYVKYKTRVTEVTFADDHEQTGRWKVTTEQVDTHDKSTDVYDGVMVCTGHHTKPLLPWFPGQRKFKGQVSHTHAYKTPDSFKGKTVVIVGVGNSGVDAAVEVSAVADSVYLATRRGCWVLGKVCIGGWPIESWLGTRFGDYMRRLWPKGASALIEMILNLTFNHQLYGLKPKHRFLEQVNILLTSGQLEHVLIFRSFHDY